MSLEELFVSLHEEKSPSNESWERRSVPSASGSSVWHAGIFIAAAYALIIAVGLVGNLTLIRTFCMAKSMRNVPNLFMSSLAFGDVLLLVTCAPVDASRYLADEWLFGRVGCKLIPFIQLTSVGVSVFTLTALAADRWETFLWGSPHAGDLHPKIHSTASFLIFYVIPLFIISVYYFFIARSLIRSAINMPLCWSHSD